MRLMRVKDYIPSNSRYSIAARYKIMRFNNT